LPLFIVSIFSEIINSRIDFGTLFYLVSLHAPIFTMRKARSSFQYFPDAPAVRQLCHSFFAGPWPAMTADDLQAMRAELIHQCGFSGIRLLAFSLGLRSFDLLLETPTALRITKKEMLARIEANFTSGLLDEFLPALRRNDPDAWQRARSNFGSVSMFMKRLKQKIASRYHQQRQTAGTLWSTRFEAAFVEPGNASKIVAAWIDHGCVRETPASSPEGNLFCTIGHAVARDAGAQSMIRNLFSDETTGPAWKDALHFWRNFCSGEPASPKPARADSHAPRLTRAQLLRHPVPHFHGGLAIGSRNFAESLFELNRHHFGDQRSSGARIIAGQNDPDLFTLRDKGDLRKPPRSPRSRYRG
jgi:hypothetical protein